jgi:hypothetical protein
MPTPLVTIRRMLLGLLLLEMIGTAVELLFLGHFEDPWQVVPLALIAAACLVLVWYGLRRSAASIHALRITMVVAIASAGIGLVLHYRGAAEFQLEIDRSQHGPSLWLKVLQAKAPPALAPGIMAHFGLLGLAYTYRHPSLESKGELT